MWFVTGIDVIAGNETATGKRDLAIHSRRRNQCLKGRIDVLAIVAGRRDREPVAGIGDDVVVPIAPAVPRKTGPCC